MAHGSSLTVTQSQAVSPLPGDLAFPTAMKAFAQPILLVANGTGMTTQMATHFLSFAREVKTSIWGRFLQTFMLFEVF